VTVDSEVVFEVNVVVSLLPVFSVAVVEADPLVVVVVSG